MVTTTTVAADDQKRLFHTLDGIRGAAAIAVFLHHFGPTKDWLPGAYLAVDLFFGLSGFVLAFSSDARLVSGLPWYAFMVQRVIRLYPLYIAGTILGLFVGVSHHKGLREIVEVLTGLLLLPSLPSRSIKGQWTGQLFPLNWAAWSLFYELVINFAYSITAKHLRISVLSIIIFLSGAAVLFQVFEYGNIDRGNVYDTFSGGIVRVVFSFSVGLIIYKLWRRGWRVPKVPSIVLAVAPFILFWLSGSRIILEPLLLFIAFPFLLLAGASNEPGRRFEWIFVVGGEISYPLYTLQAFLLQLGAKVLASRFAPIFTPYVSILLIAVVPAVLLLSWLAYLIDVPVRARLRRVWRSVGAART